MAHAKVDKNLLDEALAASGLKSKRATVEAALQLFIQINAQTKFGIYEEKFNGREILTNRNRAESQKSRVAVCQKI